jgi:hypothetical protein
MAVWVTLAVVVAMPPAGGGGRGRCGIYNMFDLFLNFFDFEWLVNH